MWLCANYVTNRNAENQSSLICSRHIKWVVVRKTQAIYTRLYTTCDIWKFPFFLPLEAIINNIFITERIFLYDWQSGYTFKENKF